MAQSYRAIRNGATQEQRDRLARRYATDLERARDARSYGDMDGYAYLMADARRVRRIIAEG